MSLKSLDRVPELDGVRGLAILLVLCFHIFKRANYFTGNAVLLWLSEPARIGWIGVDIFFVLSGFLITGILLRSREKAHYFKNFYVRRILRIFPLYYLLVGGLLIFLPALDHNAGLQTQSNWLYFMLYQQNWLYIFQPEPSLMLGFIWSLAIEEQFYLLWPSVVYFLNRKALVVASLGVVIFSLLIRIVMMQMQPLLSNYFSVPSFFYYSTVTRFEGLALGALIAIAFDSAPMWKERLARWAWPVLILFSGLFLVAIFTGAPDPKSGNQFLEIWGYSFLVYSSGALIVLVTTLSEGALLRKVFRNRMMTFFGKYSYAMYMIHLPLISILLDRMWKMGRQNFSMWLGYVVISFGGTILLSLVSWNILEKHMLSLKRYFE